VTYTALAEGAHTFAVRARDAASHLDPTPAGHIWTIDLTAPETTITAAPPAFSGSAVSFSFQSTEVGSAFECALDVAGYAPCVNPTGYSGLSSGSHTFRVRARDAAGNVDGTPASYTWTVNPATAPDLIVSALAAPATAGAGTNVTVTYTTKNQGTGTAPASQTALYLSVAATLDGSEVLLATRSVPSRVSGATNNASTSVLIPAGTASGPYHIVARADAAGVVTELDEMNNTRAVAIRIGPDLTVTALTVPATAGAGTTITVKDTTKNAVGASPANPSSTRYYLSANAVLDGGDVELGTRAVGPLAPGATSTGSAVVAIPVGTTAGSYYVIALADAGDALAELTETNNTRAATIRIGPDLTVTSLTVPPAVAAGVAISVKDTTKNAVGASPANASTTRYYLSANAILDGGDVELGNRAVGPLGPGATSTGSAVVTIPAGTVAGSYYIIALADAGDALAELTETNNTRSAAIRIGPDLTVAELAAPGAVWLGVPIEMTDTTANSVNGPSSTTSITGYYLSVDATWDAGDVELGSRVVPALAPGASSTGSVTVTVPAGTSPGKYYVVARADAGGTQLETSETNNTRAVRIVVSAPPETVTSTHPNIVVVMTDDHRADTLWAMPTVEEIAQGGVRFDQAFAVSPLCTPARAAFLTALMPSTTGCTGNDNCIAEFSRWESDTIATRLQAASYRTALIGKYLNNYSRVAPHVPPGWSRWVAFEDPKFESYRLVVDGVVSPTYSAHSTDVLSDYAIDFVMTTPPDQPLFLYLAPFAPHAPASSSPLDPATSFSDFIARSPAYNEEDVSDKPASIRAKPIATAADIADSDAFHQQQLRSLQAVDRAVARLREALISTGRWENTVFVFLSDHGLAWGEHRLFDVKQCVYEPCLKIPLVLRAPGIAPRVEPDVLVTNIDLTFTLFEFGGVSAKAGEGRSFLPRLDGRATDTRGDFLFTLAGFQGVRSERWKYVRYDGGEEELYDLLADPDELVSRHADPAYASQKAILRNRLDQLLAE
jgi:arylsulfatase A-like enzyme/subtilase family serine protease